MALLELCHHIHLGVHVAAEMRRENTIVSPLHDLLAIAYEDGADAEVALQRSFDRFLKSDYHERVVRIVLIGNQLIYSGLELRLMVFLPIWPLPYPYCHCCGVGPPCLPFITGNHSGYAPTVTRLETILVGANLVFALTVIKNRIGRSQGSPLWNTLITLSHPGRRSCLLSRWRQL